MNTKILLCEFLIFSRYFYVSVTSTQDDNGEECFVQSRYIYIYIFFFFFLMRPFGELSAFISRYPKNPPSRLEAEKLSANKVLVETICSRADSHCNYNLILGWQETGC